MDCISFLVLVLGMLRSCNSKIERALFMAPHALAYTKCELMLRGKVMAEGVTTACRWSNFHFIEDSVCEVFNIVWCMDFIKSPLVLGFRDEHVLSFWDRASLVYGSTCSRLCRIWTREMCEFETTDECVRLAGSRKLLEVVKMRMMTTSPSVCKWSTLSSLQEELCNTSYLQ